MKKDYSIIIGRFQPFHKGHECLIQTALEEAHQVIVVLGSTNSSRTVKNPWTYQERVSMIKSVFPDAPITFTGVRDYHYSDDKWIREVRAKVNKIMDHDDSDATAALIGYKKDESSYYLDLFPWFEFIESPSTMHLDATEVRRRMFEGEDWFHLVPDALADNRIYYKVDSLQPEYQFIKTYKQAWEAAPYKPTFLTVDSVINDDGHILLIQRATAPGQGLWALPGGFVNESERLIDAAIREVKEETSVDLSKKDMIQYDIFDFPSRSLRGRTITTAYYFKTTGNIKAKANDDAKQAFWVSIPDVMANEDKFFEDHYSIICKFLFKDNV